MRREAEMNWFSGALLTVAVALLIAAPGCAAEGAAKDSAKKTSAASDSAPKVLARIGDEELTREELETELARQLLPLRQKRHGLLLQGVDAWVAEELIAREAEAAGVESSAFIQREVRDKVKLPTEEEMKAFYEENKARIPGRTFEQIQPQIQAYMIQQRQRELHQKLIQRLKQEYRVATYLEPIRFDVADPEAPAMGPADAPVTIVEFSDFQCPYCARMEPVLDKAAETYGDKVRIVYRHFPLDSIHPFARKAAEASMCAAEQGKFWELHDAMFADQSKLAVEELKATAAELGLNTEAFAACLESGEFADEVQADLLAGSAVGVTGTPSVFVNGRRVGGGAVPFEQLAEVIEEELARAQEKQVSGG